MRALASIRGSDGVINQSGERVEFIQSYVYAQTGSGGSRPVRVRGKPRGYNSISTHPDGAIDGPNPQGGLGGMLSIFGLNPVAAPPWPLVA